MLRLTLALAATAVAVLGAPSDTFSGCPAGQVGVGKALVCPGLAWHCENQPLSLIVFGEGTCAPIAWGTKIGESQLDAAVQPSSVKLATHQTSVSIELDSVTVANGTVYSKCTTLKNNITCAKYVANEREAYITHCCSV